VARAVHEAANNETTVNLIFGGKLYAKLEEISKLSAQTVFKQADVLSNGVAVGSKHFVMPIDDFKVIRAYIFLDGTTLLSQFPSIFLAKA
jgi:hypothetical protein